MRVATALFMVRSIEQAKWRTGIFEMLQENLPISLPVVVEGVEIGAPDGTGNCFFCGRGLRDAKSRARGIGPTCLRRAQAELRVKRLEVTVEDDAVIVEDHNKGVRPHHLAPTVVAMLRRDRQPLDRPILLRGNDGQLRQIKLRETARGPRYAGLTRLGTADVAEARAKVLPAVTLH